MKTTTIEPNKSLRPYSTPPPRRRRRCTAVIFAALAILAFACLTGPVSAERLASFTAARYVFFSELSAARSDYHLAFANATNLPTASERVAARRQATVDFEDAVDEARARHCARRELAGDLGEDRYHPEINPADFLSPAQIAASPNPLYPLIPGTTMTYRAQTDDGIEETTVVITRETRVILGVTCVSVRDTVRLDGELLEDTIDWFAQDTAGNVWYFGESTAEYEDGLITSTEGAWRADLGAARPGIVMLAQPVAGAVYRQEVLYTEAEDAARVIALDETVVVPYGRFQHCLKTEDFTPLDPEVTEFKFYAPGVGNVLTVDPKTCKRTELISVVKN